MLAPIFGLQKFLEDAISTQRLILTSQPLTCGVIVMRVIPDRRMAMAFFLFVVVVLVASSPVQLSAASPCSGTWTGTIGPGTGTVNVLFANHNIKTSSTVSGTFNGDTTAGSLAGTMATTYSVPDMGTNGQVSSSVTGTYTMSIGSSGAVTGTGTIPLTGGFTGQFKMTLQGQESPTGQLTGTWMGTLTVTQVTYQGMALGANITAPGSGQFTGTVQQSSSQTATTAMTTSSMPEYPNYLPLLLVGLLVTLGVAATRGPKTYK